jgi:hypothetical protein
MSELIESIELEIQSEDDGQDNPAFTQEGLLQ